MTLVNNMSSLQEQLDRLAKRNGANGNLRNGRCKRHGGASTGPRNQAFGKNHHRYVHGLRTTEAITMRRLVAAMNRTLKTLSPQA